MSLTELSLVDDFRSPVTEYSKFSMARKAAGDEMNACDLPLLATTISTSDASINGL
jgi:hypothetical protein